MYDRVREGCLFERYVPSNHPNHHQKGACIGFITPAIHM